MALTREDCYKLVTVYANYKENLMTRFSTNKQKGLFIFIHVVMVTAHTMYISLTIKKNKICVVHLLAAILATEGSRLVEEKVNETKVSKTVFSRLIHLSMLRI